MSGGAHRQAAPLSTAQPQWQRPAGGAAQPTLQQRAPSSRRKAANEKNSANRSWEAFRAAAAGVRAHNSTLTSLFKFCRGGMGGCGAHACGEAGNTRWRTPRQHATSACASSAAAPPVRHPRKPLVPSVVVAEGQRPRLQLVAALQRRASGHQWRQMNGMRAPQSARSCAPPTTLSPGHQASRQQPGGRAACAGPAGEEGANAGGCPAGGLQHELGTASWQAPALHHRDCQETMQHCSAQQLRFRLNGAALPGEGPRPLHPPVLARPAPRPGTPQPPRAFWMVSRRGAGSVTSGRWLPRPEASRACSVSLKIPLASGSLNCQ